MRKFIIVNTLTKTRVNDTEYTDPKEAGRIAADLTTLLHCKHVVKPLAADDTTPAKEPEWYARERARFAAGDYFRLHPDVEAVCPPNHFAHMSRYEEGDVAFTPDNDYGSTGRKRRRAIGSYLEAYCPQVPAERRAELIEIHNTHYLDGVLLFARTIDEIADVYLNYEHNEGDDDDVERDQLNNSCMRHPTRKLLEKYSIPGWDIEFTFGGDLHPTAVYASPDLAVAHVNDDDGFTGARCLVRLDCNPPLYSRVYEKDEKHGDMLRRLLIQKGFKKSGTYYGPIGGRQHGDAVNNGGFDGARILRLPYQDHSLNRRTLMPYMDDAVLYAKPDPDDPEKYYRLARSGPIITQSTQGYADVSETLEGRCSCGAELYANAAVALNHINAEGNLTRAYICRECFDAPDGDGRTHFYCVGNGSRFSMSTPSIVIEGHRYSQHYIDANSVSCTDGTQGVMNVNAFSVVTAMRYERYNRIEREQLWSLAQVQANARVAWVDGASRRCMVAAELCEPLGPNAYIQYRSISGVRLIEATLRQPCIYPSTMRFERNREQLRRTSRWGEEPTPTVRFTFSNLRG